MVVYRLKALKHPDAAKLRPKFDAASALLMNLKNMNIIYLALLPVYSLPANSVRLRFGC